MTPNGEKVEMLKKEIELVMERNKNETYLKSLLTRALVLENYIISDKKAPENRGLIFL